MTRDKMIEMLVNSDFDYIQSGEPGGLELLQHCLKFGFKGYIEYTDAELEAEYNFRIEMENEKY
jgi:hypothetical protein